MINSERKSNEMSNEMKKCPFCQMDDKLSVCTSDRDDYFVVECGRCSACGPFGLSEKQAIAHWNGRTELQQRLADTGID
jgi:Lar family restriction alleviation protein